MLCSACPINPSALPSPEPGGGREGVSVESGRSCPPVPSAGRGASADPDNPLAGTDQAHSSVLTAVGPAPSGIRAAVEELSLRTGPNGVGQCPAPKWASGKPAEDAARLPSNAGLIDNRERGRFLLEIAPAFTAWGARVCWEKWKLNFRRLGATWQLPRGSRNGSRSAGVRRAGPG